MSACLYLPAGIAVLGWGLAALSALELAVRHPGEDRSAFWYATHGVAFFDRSSFAPTGAAAHTRFLAGVVVFFLAVLAQGAVVGVATAIGG